MGLQDGDRGEYDQIIIYKTQGINKNILNASVSR